MSEELYVMPYHAAYAENISAAVSTSYSVWFCLLVFFATAPEVNLTSDSSFNPYWKVNGYGWDISEQHCHVPCAASRGCCVLPCLSSGRGH